MACNYCDGAGDDPFHEDCYCPNCKGTGVNPPAEATEIQKANARQAADVIGDIIWRYVNTHTAEECEALKARVTEERQDRRRLFGRPVIVAPLLRKPPKNEEH